MKTLAAQFLAMSERSPALEMREDFSEEFIAELYNVPVESIITTTELESPRPSPTAVWHDSFIPVRIIGDMALEFRALCVTASEMLEPSTDPVGKWWIELRRHFRTNASVRNERQGGTITNAAFWSSQLCEILLDPSGEKVAESTKTPRAFREEEWSDPDTVQHWLRRLVFEKTTWARRRLRYPEAFTDIPGSNFCMIRLDFLKFWELEAKARQRKG